MLSNTSSHSLELHAKEQREQSTERLLLWSTEIKSLTDLGEKMMTKLSFLDELSL